MFLVLTETICTVKQCSDFGSCFYCSSDGIYNLMCAEKRFVSSHCKHTNIFEENKRITAKTKETFWTQVKIFEQKCNRWIFFRFIVFSLIFFGNSLFISTIETSYTMTFLFICPKKFLLVCRVEEKRSLRVWKHISVSSKYKFIGKYYIYFLWILESFYVWRSVHKSLNVDGKLYEYCKHTYTHTQSFL